MTTWEACVISNEYCSLFDILLEYDHACVYRTSESGIFIPHINHSAHIAILFLQEYIREIPFFLLILMSISSPNFPAKISCMNATK